MLINASQPEEVRIALVDGQKLYDLDIENRAREQKKASIYKAKITRVEPSLEAAFVDFGSERHGFLPLKEISRAYFKNNKRPTEGGQRTPIQELVREGQEIVVQVDKEERGNKGAALTTFISLAGRYVVLMPNNPRAGGISRRIEGDDRDELREALSHINVPEGMGVIVRTAGVGRSSEELNWDLDYLLQLWQAIQAAEAEKPAPTLLYQESSAVLRAIRDNLRKDVGEVLIEGRDAYAEAADFISQVMPHYREKVKPYSDGIPLFSRYQIESQIETAFQHTVKLPSGGSIVIDPTEALVSIDINSARATKGADIEETALSTNLEAADEIARQLRIRDIGGLIVIDFIDMVSQKNQRAVETRMRDALEADRARIQVSRISRFGLMEMSRQRLRPSLEEITTELCPRCNGQGRIRDTKPLALSILRVMEEEALKERSAVIRVQVPLSVGAYLLNEKRKEVQDIESRSGCHIVVIPTMHLDTPHYIVERLRDDHVAEEGEISSAQLSDLANQSKPEEMPTDTPVVQHPQAAVQSIQPAGPPPPRAAAPAAQPAPVPVAASNTAEAAQAPKGGFWSKLVKGLFSDEATSETSSAEKKPARAQQPRRSENTRDRQPARSSERSDDAAPKKARSGDDRNQGRGGNRDRNERKRSENPRRRSKGDGDGAQAKREPRSNDENAENQQSKSRKSQPRKEKDGRSRSNKSADSEGQKPAEKREPKRSRPAENRTPDEEALAASKRMPKRDRQEPRSEQKKAAEKKPAEQAAETKPAEQATETKSPESTATGKTANDAQAQTDQQNNADRGTDRAANDPRNRGGEVAVNASSSERGEKQAKAAERKPSSTAEKPASAPATATADNAASAAANNAATAAVNDTATSRGSTPETSTPKATDESAEGKVEVSAVADDATPAKSPEAAATPAKEDKARQPQAKRQAQARSQADKVVETKDDKAVAAKADKAADARDSNAADSKSNAETDNAPAAPQRPARAYNDPREVRRRAREAQLKSEGIIPKGSNQDADQDSTTGSSSSSTP